MSFPRTLVLSFAIGISLGMPSCASIQSEDLAGARVPEKAFAHHRVKIKAWKSPPVDETTEQPITELNMLVSGPGWQRKRWVKLRQGQSFEGLTLESFEMRGDAIGDPKIALAAVLIEDFSLKVDGGVPKRYLILRDFSGEAVSPFYSDTAHPPLKSNQD